MEIGRLHGLLSADRTGPGLSKTGRAKSKLTMEEAQAKGKGAGWEW